MTYPFKTKWDMMKIKEQYLDDIKLDTQLDDKTYQAVKLFKRTGQISEMTDTRTVEEKLRDIEKLKINLYNKLLQITDGIEANKIVEQIGPDQIIFLSQNFAPIEEYIKKTYSLGVPSDVFLDYLQRYIDKYNQTLGVEFNMQQDIGNQLLLNQQTIMQNMVTIGDINNINNELRLLGLQNTNIGRSVRQSLQQLEEMVNFLPTIMRTMNEETNAIERANIQRLLTNTINNLPTRQELERTLTNLQNAKEQQDQQRVIIILEALDQLATRSDDVERNLEALRQYTENQQANFDDIGRNIEALRQYTRQQKPQKKDKFKDTQIGILDYELIINTYKLKDDLKGFINENYENVEKLNDISLSDFIKERFPGKNLAALNKEHLKKIIKDMVEILNNDMFEDNRKMSGGSIAVGVKRQNKLIPFGKYMINHPKLEKNIVTIIRKGGTIINNLPSQRVSNNVGNILRKIVGGGNPTYDELNQLSDEEKRFLHKVSTMSEIDKVLIATPDKTKEEQLINEFEIMRGQILAGNDNEEIVKKFKVLILKLSKMGLLPRTEVNSLLMDLINLGH